MMRIEDVDPEHEAQRYGEQHWLDALAYFQSTEFFRAASQARDVPGADR